MDESEFSEAQYHFHKFAVQSRWIWHLRDLPQGEGINQAHDDGMSTLRNRLRNRKPILSQRFHERILLQRRQPAHVHPRPRVSVAEVVAVGFYAAEGDPTKAVDLEDVLDAGGGGDDENVGFFADADLVADGVEDLALLVSVEGEVVEAAVGEAVAII